MDSNDNKNPFKRLSESEIIQVGDYFDRTSKRYYDHVQEHSIIKVYSGDYYVALESNEMIITILGSCISACIRDKQLRIGGMNHFLLPDASNDGIMSTRYGVHAMEVLINEILKAGGKRENLEVKLFGGGTIIENTSANIGERNVEFILDYVEKEKLNVISHDLGGRCPRRVHYYPASGRARIRKLKREEDFSNVKREEIKYSSQVSEDNSAKKNDNIELFD